MTKVVFLYEISEANYQFFMDLLGYQQDIDIVIPTSLAEMEIELEDADIAVGHEIPKDIDITKSSIKLFQVPITGVDELDLNLLQEHGIQIANTHGESWTVAEHAVALLLATSRFIPYHDTNLRRGQWMNSKITKNMPVLLKDKIIVYYGYGHISRAIHELVKGFNLKTIAIKKHPEYGAEDIEDVVGDDDVDWAISQADILMITAPLTPLTKNRFTMESFESMGSSSILINVSRGAIVSEHDLFVALQDHVIAAAGLDVWWNYPNDQIQRLNTFPSRYPFHELPNVVMTPHIAWAQPQVNTSVYQDIIDNILAFHHNQPLRNLISYEDGY